MAGGMGFTESELIRVDDVLRFCKAEDAFIYNFFEYFPKYVEVENLRGRELWRLLIEMCRD